MFVNVAYFVAVAMIRAPCPLQNGAALLHDVNLCLTINRPMHAIALCLNFTYYLFVLRQG